MTARTPTDRADLERAAQAALLVHTDPSHAGTKTGGAYLGHRGAEELPGTPLAVSVLLDADGTVRYIDHDGPPPPCWVLPTSTRWLVAAPVDEPQQQVGLTTYRRTGAYAIILRTAQLTVGAFVYTAEEPTP